VGSLQANVALISASLREIQRASTRRNHVVFVADEERNYYAQFRCEGVGSLLFGELVSNTYLEPPSLLDLDQIDELLRRGWGLGNQNFFKTWEIDDDRGRDEIACETMMALIAVYGVPTNTSITSTVTFGRTAAPRRPGDTSHLRTPRASGACTRSGGTG
jgi:hypothetical protein